MLKPMSRNSVVHDHACIGRSFACSEITGISLRTE